MDAVAEVKRRVDLVEFIGRVTKLQKAGRNFRGLCPFHTEKTPSFYVFPDKGNWRCFGSCGEGGDLFSFVQKRENVDFRDALKTLASEAGVELSRAASARRSRAEQLTAIVTMAVDYYRRAFEGAEGERARRYILEARGLTAETAAAFQIGWAADEWRALGSYLNARGYEDGDLVAAGVLVEPESGGQPYDRFRGRVIVPIADERGQFVALGGRGLGNETPKYLNSPQTEIFDKGRTLFALHGAAEAMRASGIAVVVDGYMDVIGPWQAGFRNVVATMGTSLTEQHVQLLRRFARRVVLAMDPDAAGLAAAERAGGLFMGFDSPLTAAKATRSAEAVTAGSDVELRVAPLPGGRDPDELVRDNPADWSSAVDGAVPYAAFLLDRLMEKEEVASPVEARRMVDRLRPVLLAVSDPVERAMYVQRVARRLDVSEAAVHERIRPAGRNRTPSGQSAPAGGTSPTPEQLLLAILVRHAGLRTEFRQLPERLFTEALDREVFLRWAHETPDAAEADDPVEAHRRWLETRRLPPLDEQQARTAAREKLRQITRERVVLHQAAVSEQLAEAEREFGAGAVAELASDVWRGRIPADEHREVAETVIEDLQLGLSIHRREDPALR